tara:strand:- start:1066 stop:1644 length:579 start_codon:yes stop_codon:yes gene_type:complete
MNHFEINDTGYLELIVGPMFSGKTSRIIDIYKQYTYCNIPVLVINHSDDNRYDSYMLTNHDNINIDCVKGNSIKNIILNTKQNYKVILINEGQFFDNLCNDVIDLVNNQNKCVYICGLDGDYKANKFGDILDLIPYCDKVEKLNSICTTCKNGRKAIFSHRKINNNSEQKLVGLNDIYEPLCRKCYLAEINT